MELCYMFNGMDRRILGLLPAGRLTSENYGLEEELYTPISSNLQKDSIPSIPDCFTSLNFAPNFNLDNIKTPAAPVSLEASFASHLKNLNNQKSKTSNVRKNSGTSKEIVYKAPELPYETPLKIQCNATPLTKFINRHKSLLDGFLGHSGKEQAKILAFNTNPVEFFDKPGLFFTGLAKKAKEIKIPSLQFSLLRLAIYTEPLYAKSWDLMVELMRSLGQIRAACGYSKAGYLFTSSQTQGQGYLNLAQECQLNFKEIVTILHTPKTPDRTILVEVCKLGLKYDCLSHTLRMLIELWKSPELKALSGPLSVFIASFLENIGRRVEGIAILRKSMSQNAKINKAQICISYFDINLRHLYSMKLSIEDFTEKFINLINQVAGLAERVPQQTQYRVYLELAEVTFKLNILDFRYYLQLARSAVESKKVAGPKESMKEQGSLGFPAPPLLKTQSSSQSVIMEPTKKKALKLIYITTIRLLSIEPPLAKGKSDPCILFQQNRYSYITCGQLNEYEFDQWKYYLHFGLTHNVETLAKACQNWPQTGRLVAQRLHQLRSIRPAKEMLTLWQSKIMLIPKSGQLWCEGGRIYSNLGDFNSASRCFNFAIKFTPQYGDSFVEELKASLRNSRLRHVEYLRRLVFVEQPHYGHAWSFLKLSFPNGNPCFEDMWTLAVKQVKESLYEEARESSAVRSALTALPSYNEAHANPVTSEIRAKLFYSYQLLDSKS